MPTELAICVLPGELPLDGLPLRVAIGLSSVDFAPERLHVRGCDDPDIGG